MPILITKKNNPEINNLYFLTFYHNALDKKEQIKPKGSRRKEVIRMGAEIYAIDNRRTVNKINKTKRFFENINKIDKTL